LALIRTHQRGETIPIWRTVKNSSSTLVNPDQGCTITLTDPDGNAAVAVDSSDITDAAMTNSSTGTYVYYYRSATTDKKGQWNYSCKATDGTGNDAKFDIKKGAFNLT
jgi:hypothetical protein